MTETGTNTITNGKYVELTYLVRDSKTGDVLTEAPRPLSYVHGVNEILAPTITQANASTCLSTATSCTVRETSHW
jgi:FKBP-type peptidyl-prolyl cis-trans isomerase SlyD